MTTFPTYAELEKDYQSGRAELVVEHLNHREFVKDGVKYYCGYSSQRAETYADGTYRVQGWMTYKRDDLRRNNPTERK